MPCTIHSEKEQEGRITVMWIVSQKAARFKLSLGFNQRAEHCRGCWSDSSKQILDFAIYFPIIFAAMNKAKWEYPCVLEVMQSLVVQSE